MIENLNDVDADVVFVKNIDNVVPDSFKCSTVIFKKVIAGVLVSLQERIFKYLELIDSGKYSHDQVEEMIHFFAGGVVREESGNEVVGRCRVDPLY